MGKRAGVDCRGTEFVGGASRGTGWGVGAGDGGGTEVPEEIGIWIDFLVCRWGEREAGGDVCGHSGIVGLCGGLFEGLRLCVMRKIERKNENKIKSRKARLEPTPPKPFSPH